MARGGINKAHVKNARDAVILRGDNPSIDTIRIELGNTGSKTTIHRYLKALEEEEGTRLDDNALLSDTLRSMVAKLANQLQQEARQLVDQSAEHHKVQSDRYKNQIQELEEKTVTLTELLESKSNALATSESELKAVMQQKQKESDTRIELAGKIEALETRLTDKDTQIHSLEEKHQHARDALEHFRQSAKEQREQEILRHEQQIQQIQAEQRQLNQTLIVKQDELTKLNNDNGRLVTQLKESQKQNTELTTSNKSLESKLTQSEKAKTILTHEIETLQQKITLAKEKLDQQYSEKVTQENTNKIIEKELKQSKKENRDKELELTKLKAEVHTQIKIFSQLKASNKELV